MAKTKKNNPNFSKIQLWTGVEKTANFLTILGFFVATYFAWLSVQNQEEIGSLKEIALNTGRNEEKISASLDSFSIIIQELRLENANLSMQSAHLSIINKNTQSQLFLAKRQLNEFVENTKPKIDISDTKVQNVGKDSLVFTYELKNFGGRTAWGYRVQIFWIKVNDQGGGYGLYKFNTPWLGEIPIGSQQSYTIFFTVKRKEENLKDFLGKTLTVIRYFYIDSSTGKEAAEDICMGYAVLSEDKVRRENLRNEDKENLLKYLKGEKYFSNLFAENKED